MAIPRLSKTAEKVVREHRSAFITRFPPKYEDYLSFPFGYDGALYLCNLRQSVVRVRKAHNRKRPFSLVVNWCGIPLRTKNPYFLRPVHAFFEQRWDVEIVLEGEELNRLVETFSESDRFATLKLRMDGENADLCGFPLGKAEGMFPGRIDFFSKPMEAAMRLFRALETKKLWIRVRYGDPGGVCFSDEQAGVDVFIAEQKTPPVGDGG